MTDTMDLADIVDTVTDGDSGPATTAAPNLDLSQKLVRGWLEDQIGEALAIWEETIRTEAIEIFGGMADLLLVGPFQFTGAPGTPPYPPGDVVRVGEPAFVAAVQVYAPLPNIAGSAPAFELPYDIEFRTGSLHNWSLAEPALQNTTSDNLTAGVNIYVDFFVFTPTQADLCEMNAWIQVDTALNQPSGVGGFARSVIPVVPPALFPVDPPPSDTGLRFAAVDVP